MWRTAQSRLVAASVGGIALALTTSFPLNASGHYELAGSKSSASKIADGRLPSQGRFELFGQRATRTPGHLHRGSGNTLCLDLFVPGRQLVQCSHVPRRREPVLLRTSGYECKATDGYSYAIGTTARRVARVLVEFVDGKRVEAKLHAAPRKLGIRKRFFVALRRYGYVVRRVSAFDRSGGLVKERREPLEPDDPGSRCPRPTEG
jgi:hypothetical protein